MTPSGELGAGMETIAVGEWAFSPATASLSRAGTRRRLEHRAARVLELLCRRRGAPVATEELIDAVWDGRAVSQNSVAVVIGDLRRALGDDSRRPRYIETIPKRGYRLLAASAPAAPVPALPDGEALRTPAPRGLIPLVAAFASIAAIALPLAWQGHAQAPLVIAVAPIPNETGDSANTSLALAVGDLVTAELAGLEGVRVVRAASGAPADARLGGRLVMWNRQVSLSLSAEDPATGEVLWSAIAAGPAAQLPRQIRAVAAHFGDYAETRRTAR